MAKGLVALALLAASAAHAAMLFRLFSAAPHNSDAANNLLAAADIVHGNTLLSGWKMAADNYVPEELLLYVVSMAVVGVRPILLYVIPALIWAALTLTCAVLVLRRVPPRATAGGLLAVATLMGLPIMAGVPEMGVISQVPVHFVTVLYGLWCFILAEATLRATSLGRAAGALILLAILMAAGAFGDPMALVVTAAPLLLVSALFGAYGGQRRGRHVAVACAVLAGVVAARIALDQVTAYGGFTFDPIETRFAEFWRMGFNLALAAETFLVQNGADFFGKKLSIDLDEGAGIALLRLPLALLVLTALIGMGWRTVRAGHASRVLPDRDYVDLLLLAAFVLITASMVSSSMTLDVASRRYMFPALIYGTALVGRNFPRTRLAVGYAAAAALGSAAFTAAAIARTPPTPAFLVPDQQELLDRVQALGLDEGFASYWDGSILTVMTRGRVRVLALQPSGDGVGPYLWFSPKRLYAEAAARTDGRFFAIVHLPADASTFTEAQAQHAFGTPLRREAFGRYVLDVFDRAGKPLDALRP